MNSFWPLTSKQKISILSHMREIDITLRYRMFQVSYTGASGFWGSRVKIRDLRHKKTKSITYRADGGRTGDQAIEYLESIGISIQAIGLAHEDCDCMLLSEDTSTPLK